MCPRSSRSPTCSSRWLTEELLLEGGNRDHLHYGSISGRQLGAMNSGHKEGKRTDDFLGG
jgi:hypothetical protein